MNILSSLTTPSQPVYSHEAMTRKSARAYIASLFDGNNRRGLVLEAFGRMIDGGDPLAPMLTTERRFSLEIFDAPFGPVVAVTEIGSNTVYMIRPASVAVREAA